MNNLHSCHILFSSPFLQPMETRKFCTRMHWMSVFLKDLSVCYYIRDSTGWHTVKKKDLAFIFLYLLHINNTVGIYRKCSVLKLQFFVGPLFFLPDSRYSCTPNFSHRSTSMSLLSIITGDTHTTYIIYISFLQLASGQSQEANMRHQNQGINNWTLLFIFKVSKWSTQSAVMKNTSKFDCAQIHFKGSVIQ